MDEKELCLKIREFLNKNSMDLNFKFVDDFVDIADEIHKVYIEVKLDHFAPAQLLHAIAKKGIKNARYLGVADSSFVKLYAPPVFEKIYQFATNFDPTLVFTPSQVDKPDLNAQASVILGEAERIIKLDFSQERFLYINQDNLKSIKPKLDKYRIEIDLLVKWLDGLGESESLKVNREGWLVNMDKPEMFLNERAKSINDLPHFLGFHRPKHIAIKHSDVAFFESLRVKHEDLAQVLHEVDRFLSRKKRRQHGVFWTEEEIGDKIADEILEITKPDYVVEPCVGGGSLLKNIVPKVKGAMNDIDAGHAENCKKIFDGYNWKFTSRDIVNSKTSELMKEWEIPAGKQLLIYTNPPFGTTSTNRLASKKAELNGNLSRKQKIIIPPSLEKYGKGNLYLPIVGRFIEIAKTQKNAHVAFFSPLALFCARVRHYKLFSALLKDFRFVKGYVFAGHNFHDINKTLPIAFSIWKYQRNSRTKHSDIELHFISIDGTEKRITFKKMPLLKDSWRYDRRDKGELKDELVVQHCESFDTPAPKVIHLNPLQGGSEMIPDNVLKPLGISRLPDELVYGLWSMTVGLGAYGTSLSNPIFPIYMRDAYVPLPDFSRREAIEILAYSALHALIKNYAGERIGFFGSNKVFRFGGERLTEGVKILFEECKDCLVYNNNTIDDTLDLIKQSKVDITKMRKGIISEVQKRLESIGYWDYIPIP